MIQFLKPSLFFLPTLCILQSAVLLPVLLIALFSCHQGDNIKLKQKVPLVKGVYNFKGLTDKISSTLNNHRV